MDVTEGLAPAIDRIAELATAAKAKAEFLPIPEAARPPGLLVGNPHLLLITNGDGSVRLESFARHVADLRGKPARRTGTATAATLGSFIDLVVRNGNDETVIFVDADWRKPRLTAVLNYHHQADTLADADPGDDPLARFGDHRVVYSFPLSEPWKAWVAMDGKPMEQAEFAAFLEDHIHEIAAESEGADERRWKEDFRTTIAQPSDLIDLARGLEIHVGQRVASRQKLQSGETQMVFETEHRDANGAELTVPGLFILKVPVFYRGEPHRVPVRLRYRTNGNGIVWFYQIFRPDEFVDARVRADVEIVRTETGRAVIDGAPEAEAAR